MIPSLAVLILLWTGYKDNLRGPNVVWVQSIVQSCHSTWWYYLTGVHNYLDFRSCLSHTWYVAADLQLYFVSPLLLFPLNRWRWKFVPMLALVCLFPIYFVLQSGSTLIFTTHGRFGPWILGILLGFVLLMKTNCVAKENEPGPMTGTWLERFFVLLGWIICIPLLNYVLHPKVSSMFYYAVHRYLWAIFISWIIFMCHQGWVPFLNKILSIPAFQFLSKLSYCVYLLHLPIKNTLITLSRQPLYFESSTRLYEILSLLFVSTVLAFFWSLLFELPWTKMEQTVKFSGFLNIFHRSQGLVQYHKLSSK